ncbi:ABC transporter ATP-binding protein [bacterium]|nr:ABC transporter ATP-binding protein [bacterium]
MDCIDLTYKISDKTVLNSVNLSFSESGIHVIIGPNGAGKSTLLSLLAKQKKPTSGKILINKDEKPTSKKNEKTEENSKLSINSGLKPTESIIKTETHPQTPSDSYVKNEKNIDYLEKIDLSELNEAQFYKKAVFSGNYDTPFHEITVEQFLLLNRYLKTGALQFDDAIEKLTDFFNLKPFLYRYINTLSSGERQKIALASLFLLEREYIIMDEPFSALDISARYEMSEKITEYIDANQKIIIVSHTFELLNYSKSISAIKNGVVFFKGKEISKNLFFELFDIKNEIPLNFLNI